MQIIVYFILLTREKKDTLFQNSFQLVHHDQVDELYHSITFITENEKEMSWWVEKIRECISSQYSTSLHLSKKDSRGDNLRSVSIEAYLECKKTHSGSFEKYFAQLRGETIFLYSSKKVFFFLFIKMKR